MRAVNVSYHGYDMKLTLEVIGWDDYHTSVAIAFAFDIIWSPNYNYTALVTFIYFN